MCLQRMQMCTVLECTTLLMRKPRRSGSSRIDLPQTFHSQTEPRNAFLHSMWQLLTLQECWCNSSRDIGCSPRTADVSNHTSAFVRTHTHSQSELKSRQTLRIELLYLARTYPLCIECQQDKSIGLFDCHKRIEPCNIVQSKPLQ